MSAKGSSKTCCCGGCAERPFGGTGFDATSGDDSRKLHPLQQFCCACIPSLVCCVISRGDVEYRVVLSMSTCISLDSYGTVTSGYTGTIPINGVDVPIRFHFDVIYEQCVLILTSPVLITSYNPEGTSTLVIDEYNRDRICRSFECLPCDPVVDPYDAFDPYGCAHWVEYSSIFNDDTLFQLCPAATSSLVFEDRVPCPYCPVDPYQQHCGSLCDGCNCLCSEACLTVVINDITGGDSSYISYRVRFDELAHTYTTIGADGGEYQITVRPNYVTRECEMALTMTGPYTPANDPEPVLIGSASATNPCPSPTASFTFVDSNNILIGVQVLFSCATCKECDQISMPQCCPDGDGTIPRILIASATAPVDCCGPTISIVLVYQPTSHLWLGRAENAWAAEGPYCDRFIELALSCSAEGWSLAANTDSACAAGNITLMPGGTCSPLNMSFEVVFNGPGCCHHIAIPPAVDEITLTFVITE